MTRTSFLNAIWISAITAACIALAGANAYGQDGQGLATPDTGLTDPHLLGLVGAWTGTYTMGDDSGLAELEWKKAISGQWMQGILRFWKGQDKNTLVYDEFIFLRPADTPDAYKGYTVDNFGVAQVARGTVNDGIWQWTWNYDDGHVETGEMNTTDPNKTAYRGTVVDKDGKPAGEFTFDVTRMP